METQLVHRYAANMNGMLSCYDRILMIGTLTGACYAGGMTSFLYSKGIRIFDYAKFAEPLRERICDCAQEVCKAAGLEIEHVGKSHIRKEDLVARVLEKRGDAPGLVHVLSAMEGFACIDFKLLSQEKLDIDEPGTPTTIAKDKSLKAIYAFRIVSDAFARWMGQYKVAYQVSGVQGKRDELIDICVIHSAAVLEALAVYQLE